jgi:hypothetical protein
MRLDSLPPPLFSAYGVGALTSVTWAGRRRTGSISGPQGTEFLGRRLRELASEPEKLLRA